VDRFSVMEAYVRVLETGSFSTAAREQNVGQSAISRSIAQLEERLGVRLLMRSTRGVTPTEAGQAYYKRARRAIQEAEEADLVARLVDMGLTGRLRVSASSTFTRLYLVPGLPAFLATHPKLSIDLVLSDLPPTFRISDLIEEGVAIGLRFGPLSDSSLMGRKIAETPRMVLGTPDYFERTGVPTRPADLIGHEAVIYTQDVGGGDTWIFNKGDSQVSVTLSTRLRLSASEVLRAAVLNGIGLAIASQWMFAPELACGAVRAVLAEWTLPNIELWVVFPTGRMPDAKARAFAAFVESEMNKHRNQQTPFESEITHMRSAPLPKVAASG
jgi:DNA-binding transcriptional LysR family regulator